MRSQVFINNNPTSLPADAVGDVVVVGAAVERNEVNSKTVILKIINILH